MKLTKTFSGSDLLLESPSTSPVVDRRPLAAEDAFFAQDLFGMAPPTPFFPSSELDSAFNIFEASPFDALLGGGDIPPPATSNPWDHVDFSDLLASLGSDLQSSSATPGYVPVSTIPLSSTKPSRALSRQASCIDPAMLFAPPASVSTQENVEQVEVCWPPQDVLNSNINAVNLNDIFNVNDKTGEIQAEDGVTEEYLPLNSVNLKQAEMPEPSTRATRAKRRRAEEEDDYAEDSLSEDYDERPRVRPARKTRRVAYPSPPCSTGTDDEDLDRPYACTDCGLRFRRDAERVRHAAVHLPTAQQALTCNVCKRSVGGGRKDAMRRHQLRTALCLKKQVLYSDAQLEAMGCVTSAEREAWKQKTAASKR
ncbi:hypothetical protein EXIGLDRAFT_758126 [Exidia glandulosa HHB12029]|uniref:C2H2-type domain-containing protein n=1 Tax=Exidia glandulosa HHB12029 TaxID=1314781 RepID=A0A165QLY3_EXIGL|nr:hypothetical protein EXIGLDRAFT_758126 [Exidia glandulosa HHB12029]